VRQLLSPFGMLRPQATQWLMAAHATLGSQRRQPNVSGTQGEDRLEIARRGLADCLDRDALEGGDALGDQEDMGRLVAPATIGVWRQVGGVRFGQDPVEGDEDCRRRWERGSLGR